MTGEAACPGSPSAAELMGAYHFAQTLPIVWLLPSSNGLAWMKPTLTSSQLNAA